MVINNRIGLYYILTDVILPFINLLKILKVSLTNIIYTAEHPFK